MSGRYPFSPGGTRYPPRERTPPGRYSEKRRPSSPRRDAPGSGLGESDSRPAAEETSSRNTHSNSGGEFLFPEPPKAPKAWTERLPRGRGSSNNVFIHSGPRGRGFFGRGEPRGRSYRFPRGSRGKPYFRGDRDRDRSWKGAEYDDDRRQSPPPRGRRHTRDYDYLKELDVDHARRTSKDGPLSAASSSSDPSLRSGVDRGREQGDWTAPGNVRGSFRDERERIPLGPNAKERGWERVRDDPDRDRRILRREESKKIEREEREREAEKYKKDRASGQFEQSTISSTSANLPPSHVLSTSAHESGDNRRSSADSHTEFSFNGRASGGGTASYNLDARRDKEEVDRHSSRVEPSFSRYGSRVASPPRAPPVPAFGSQSRSSFGGPFSLVWKAPSSSQGSTQLSSTSNVALSKNVSTEPNKPSEGQPSSALKADGESQHAEITEDRSVEIAGKSALQENDNPLVQQSNSSPGHSGHASAASSDPRLQNTTASPEGSASIAFRPYNRSVSASAQGSGHSAKDHFNQGAGPTDSAGRSFPPSSPGATLQVPRGPKAGRIGRGRGNWSWGLPHPTARGSYNGPVSIKRDHAGRERGRFFSGGRGMGRHGANEVEGPPTQDLSQMNMDEQTRQPTDLSTSIKSEDQEVTEDVGMLNTPAKTSSDLQAVESSKSQDGDKADEDETDFLEETDMEDIWAKREDEINIATVKAREEKNTISRNIRLMHHVLHEVHLLALQKMAEVPEANAAAVQENPTVEAKETEVAQLPIPGEISMEDIRSTNQESSTPDVPSAEPDSTEPEANSAAARDAEPYEPPTRQKTPPLNSLPFLIPGPQKPFRELEIIHENEKVFEENKASIMELLESRAKEEADTDEKLRREWTENYRRWRSYVEQLDEELGVRYEDERDQKASSPENTSPTVPMTPIERRRGGKYASELDIQEVLKKSAEEEKERAKQLAGAKLENEKEADIPDMLNDRQRYVFRDRNRLVSSTDALEVFQVQPLEDVFTAEEQKTFIERFQLYPKQFGKIAEGLPGRTFQQCIEHYYKTKGEAKYKQLLSKRKKRGRRAGQGTQSKPRSTALIRSEFAAQPDVLDGDDLDAPAVAVTDTGRPRRAAAPTFGEATADNESNTPTQTTGRRTGGASRSDTASDAPTEKVTRRTRVGATRERAQRRGRNQLIAAAPAPQQALAQPIAPLGLEGNKETAIVMNRDSNAENDLRMKDLESAQLLAGLQAGNTAVGGTVVMAEENLAPLVPASTPVAISPKPSRSQTRSAAQTTSYWSVTESNDFPRLLDHFGTDWQAIATHMTSKTQIMVKNFYKREVDAGRLEWKQRAELADARKLKGEVMGPPPAPTQPRRRHESLQPNVPRVLAPSIETIEIEDDSPPKLQPAVLVQTPPPQLTQRPKAPVLAQAESSPVQPEPLQRTVNLQPRSVLSAPLLVEQIISSQRSQGPRAGYFFATSEAPAAAQNGSQQSFHAHPSLQPQPVHSNYESQASSSTASSTYSPLPSSHQATLALGQQRAVFDTSQSESHVQALALQQQQQQQSLYSQRSQQAPRQKHDQYKEVPAVSSPAQRYPTLQPTIAPPSTRQDYRSIVSSATEPRPVPTAARQPEPTPRKTSSIMSLLNSTEPEEPRVRIHYDLTRTAPTPPPATQAASQAPHSAAGPPLYFPSQQQITTTQADPTSRREQAASVELQASSGHPTYQRPPTYSSSSSYTVPTQHQPVSLPMQDILSSSSSPAISSTSRPKWVQTWTVPAATTSGGVPSQYPSRQTTSTTTAGATSTGTGASNILPQHHLQYASPTASGAAANLQQQQIPVQYHHPPQQQQQQANPLQDNPHRPQHQRTRSASSSATMSWPGAGSHGHGHGPHMY